MTFSVAKAKSLFQSSLLTILSSAQEGVNHLHAALSQAEEHVESEQRQVSSAIIAMQELLFAYIDKLVTCNIVKPFLPCLLGPALKIRIPTPIIAHLHNCRQCFEEDTAGAWGKAPTQMNL